jgi:PAS domain S-box-containing protein
LDFTDFFIRHITKLFAINLSNLCYPIKNISSHQLRRRLMNDSLYNGRILSKVNLGAEESFLSTILETMDVLVIVLDPKGRVIRFNQACQRLFGYTADELKRKLTTGLLPLPKEITALKALISGIKSVDQSKPYETVWVSSSGEYHTIAWSIKIIENTQGAVQYKFATGVDITWKKKVEDQLEKERLFLQSLINAIPDPIFYKNVNGAYVGCNKAFEAFRGIKASEIIGHDDEEYYTPEAAHIFLKTDQQVIQSGKPVHYENWTRSPRGTAILIETRKNPYHNTDGEIIGVIGVGRDITRHRLVENDLRKAKAEIEQILACLSSVLITITPDLVVSRFNKMAEKVFGIPSAKIIGLPVIETEISWDWETIHEGILNCAREKTPIYLKPISFKRTGGEAGLLGVNVSPISENFDSISGFIILGADITYRKNHGESAI